MQNLLPKWRRRRVNHESERGGDLREPRHSLHIVGDAIAIRPSLETWLWRTSRTATAGVAMVPHMPANG